MTDLIDNDDVDRLVRIIASLEASSFDYLQLRVGDLDVVLGKGDPAAAQTPAAIAPAAVATTAPAAVATPSPTVVATAAPAAAPSAPPAPAQTGSAITAPIMGIFYAQPAPGEPPYVAVGDVVTPETTVGLIEVMKTFNSVTAGVAGTITEVCVVNHDFVEYEQPLFRVQPD